MNPNILHVGLDVDDTQYHGSAFNKETGEVIDFRCRPTLKGLLTQLDKLQRQFRRCTLRLCYEASYVGYCLQRDLRAHRVHCDVVAPSSIPSPRGKAVKTDRIDAGLLAQCYANDLLTIVQPPDLEQEQDRDLLRTRQKLLRQRTQSAPICTHALIGILARLLALRANRHASLAGAAAAQWFALQDPDRLQEPPDQAPLCLAATSYQELIRQPAGQPDPAAAPGQRPGRGTGGVWPAHRGVGGHATLPGGRTVTDVLQRHQENFRPDHDHRDR